MAEKSYYIWKSLSFSRFRTTSLWNCGVPPRSVFLKHFICHDHLKFLHLYIYTFSVLGFYRVVPVVGRVLDMKKEIEELCDTALRHTFFTSPANKTCFYGTCMIYCNLFDPVCGTPNKIEGSIAAYLPQFRYGRRKVCIMSTYFVVMKFLW